MQSPWVAIDGDHIIASAPYYNSSEGVAYIFYRNEGGTDQWGLKKTLLASDAAVNHGFGIAVAIDGSTAVVGQGNYNSASTYAAYVFLESLNGPDNWGEQKRISPPRIHPLGVTNFGRAVSVSGDYVAVGDLLYSQSASYTAFGAAYVFNRNQNGTGNWGLVHQFTGPAQGSDFGDSISIKGNVLAVPAPHDHSGKGTLYIYMQRSNPTNWGEVAVFSPTDTEAGFGGGQFSVSIGSDVIGVGALGSPSGPIGYSYVLGYATSPPPPFISGPGGMSSWEPVREIIFN